MFIVLLNYKVPITLVDKYIDAHKEYLKKQYKSGNFLASGRKVPRTGGVILSNISDKNALNQVLSQDSFNQNNLADYEIIEFIPNMACEKLNFLI